MTHDHADGSGSAAAEDAGAVRDVARNTKSQTEAASYIDDRGLAFVYQERTGDGRMSRFNKFVRRESDKAPGT